MCTQFHLTERPVNNSPTPAIKFIDVINVL